MHRTFLMTAAVLGALGVALGAFGAHGLAAVFEANGRAATYDTAVQYHLIHALALFGIGMLAERYPHRFLHWAGWFFLAGVILFSGSLYILAVFDIGIMGAVAPLGGTAMIVGWLLTGLAVWQS